MSGRDRLQDSRQPSLRRGLRRGVDIRGQHLFRDKLRLRLRHQFPQSYSEIFTILGIFFSIRPSSLRMSEVQFPQDFIDIYFFRYFLAKNPAPPGFRRSNFLGISVIFTFLDIFSIRSSSLRTLEIQLPQDYRDFYNLGIL